MAILFVRMLRKKNMKEILLSLMFVLIYCILLFVYKYAVSLFVYEIILTHNNKLLPHNKFYLRLHFVTDLLK